MHWTKDKIEYLQNEYASRPYAEIGMHFGITEMAVKAKVRYLGLCKQPRYQMDISFFRKWSNDMAYIIGYLMADGCIESGRNTLSLCINKQDVGIIHFLNSKISPNHHIYEYKNGRLVSVKYNSAELISVLATYGLISRKTGLETIKYIDKDYIPDFIRGYFDGDGCISLRKKSKDYSCFICSQSKEILNDIQVYFKFGSIVNKGKYTKSEKDFYNFNITRKSDIEQFRSIIYKTGSFCLNRKKDRLFSINTDLLKVGRHAIIRT